MIKLILPDKEDTKLEPIVGAIAIAIGAAAGILVAVIALIG